jgi:predicted transcriptional regulator
VRESLGLSRKELGAKIGLSRFSVFNFETGRRNPPLSLMRPWLVALEKPGQIELFAPHPLFDLIDETHKLSHSRFSSQAA